MKNATRYSMKKVRLMIFWDHFFAKLSALIFKFKLVLKFALGLVNSILRPVCFRKNLEEQGTGMD